MRNHNSIEEFLEELKQRLKKEMPRIKKEIKTYEKNLSSGELTKKPIPSAQFNG